MATGSKWFRNRAGSDNLEHGAWGVQPSEPLTAGRFPLPAKETVDYVHSLTQTTLLLAGVVVFAVIHRGRGQAALRKLAGRVAT
jgi:hypothetical protein